MAAENPTPGGLRIGNAERDRTMALLREHTAAGRLDLDEFEERAGQVAAARTGADLDQVLFDLPRLPTNPAGRAHPRGDEPPYAAVPPSGPGARAIPPHSYVYWGGSGLPGWLGLSLLMVAIWAMAGFGYFWPMWVIVPTALGAVGGGRHHHRGAHPHHHQISA